MPPKRTSMKSQAEFDIQWQAGEVVLERVKHSCYKTHLMYRQRYLLSRARLMYYDVPIIVLSSVNSVFIAGGSNFLREDIVNITTCMLALTVGIIQALKTFFKVDDNRENCLMTYKDLFRLFCELSIILDQPRITRGVDPQKFMADKNSEYKEIMNRAIVLEDPKSKQNPIYLDLHPFRKPDNNVWFDGSDISPNERQTRIEMNRALTFNDDIPTNIDVGLPLTQGDSYNVTNRDDIDAVYIDTANATGDDVSEIVEA
uniref:VP11 n=1 Tax=viral metagenome TaxID=1070528 RepID=A0A2V0RBD7_9ZZZZ